MRCSRSLSASRVKTRADFVDGANALGHVGREFDDLHDLVVRVENRIVGRLDPNFLAALADALELGGDIFAAVQLPPEFLVFGRLRVGRLDEHAMMLAFDLVEAIAEHVEEILVGGDDFAIGREFDDRLDARDRVDLALELGVSELLRR